MAYGAQLPARQPLVVVEGHTFRAENAACSSENPGIRFRSEVPDNAAARENIVLAAPVRSHIELRHTRPEVSTFRAQAESMEDLHIESEAYLEYAGVRPCLARVMASEEQGRAV